MRCSSPCPYFSSSPPETFATIHLPRPDFQPTKQPNHTTVRILFHTKFNASSNCSRLNLVYFIYRGRTFPLPCRIHYKHFPNILRILVLLVTISKNAAGFSHAERTTANRGQSTPGTGSKSIYDFR